MFLIENIFVPLLELSFLFIFNHIPTRALTWYNLRTFSTILNLFIKRKEVIYLFADNYIIIIK